MTGRKCSTCKHYDASQIWRKGWCRNPLLFSPQQSHLVGADDVDCERGMGNYWEAIPGAAPLQLIGRTPDQPDIIASRDGQPVYGVSGSSGYPPDDLDDEARQAADRGQQPAGRGGGSFGYAPEERYWTDYLRVAAPIVGVLLMLILFWVWATSFLGDDDENGTTGGAGATQTTTLPILTASPTASAPAGATGTPQIVLTPPPPGSTTTVTQPQVTPPVEQPGEIYAGATVQVANTGGTGANLRSQPSTAGDVVSVLIDGTELVTTGDAVEAEGFVWWPVTGEAGDGFLVADYLVLIQ